MTSDSGADIDSALEDLASVQRQLAASLATAVELSQHVQSIAPELTAGLEDQPLEAILREMVAARDRATEDREQVARLLVLVNRLKETADANASGLGRLENAGEIVAGNLRAQQERADAVADGKPGEAADAGMRSADQ